MSAPESRFVRACRRQPVDATPVWFMRQAGRYMPEYRAVRKQHSLLEICKTPQLAAEVTITAAEKLGVDAAIIFADLLLPLETMGLDFHFASGEGPVIENPLRTVEQVRALHDGRAAELGYVCESIRLVSKHFSGALPVIGFCGAPFTLASYMIEGGGSRHYLETKKFMLASPKAWELLMHKLTRVLAEYAVAQARAGADAIQVFDSWVGCLAPDDYRTHVLPHTKRLIGEIQGTGGPVIYFGTETTALLKDMPQTRAEVIGLDWRVRLDEAWAQLGHNCAVQGNLDPAVLLGSWPVVREHAQRVLDYAAGRAGHIFNLGHGILPDTPVENVRALADFVHEYSARRVTASVAGMKEGR
jgi:uroporphyrinogen decarboxylase